MDVLIIYDPYEDTYTTVVDYLFDRDTPWRITISEDILFIDTHGSSLKFTYNLGRSGILVFYSSDLNLVCNFERITKYLEPLIEEILTTRDIKLMKYLYKSLFPLLNRTVITQRMIDEYELPQKVPTKSARN
jgi:hypothetical protein